MMRAGKQDADWRMIRMDVRHLCYEASLLLEAGKGLKDLRPRPLTSDLKTIRDDLVRVLVGWDWRSLPGVDRELHEIFVNNLLVALCQQEGPVFSELNPIRDDLIRFLAGRDWWSLPASFRGPIPTEIRIYDLLIALCKQGQSVGNGWGIVFELIESGFAETSLRPRSDPAYTDLNAGEGQIFLKLTPAQFEAYRLSHESASLEKPIIVETSVVEFLPSESHKCSSIEVEVGSSKPVWDIESRELSFNGQTCRTYARAAPSQFEILNSFQAKGWPSRISNPLDNDASIKSTIKDINKNTIIIKFSFRDEDQKIGWKFDLLLKSPSSPVTSPLLALHTGSKQRAMSPVLWSKHRD